VKPAREWSLTYRCDFLKAGLVAQNLVHAEADVRLGVAERFLDGIHFAGGIPFERDGQGCAARTE
jgi:hypothetical protein